MSSARCKEDVYELQQLNIETKRLLGQLRELRQHKKAVEGRIIEYLAIHDQPGLKLENVVVMAEDKERRPQRKKKERYDRTIQVLQAHGLPATEKLAAELIESTRGSPTRITSLTIKNGRKN
jgi:hypothetical protein